MAAETDLRIVITAVNNAGDQLSAIAQSILGVSKGLKDINGIKLDQSRNELKNHAQATHEAASAFDSFKEAGERVSGVLESITRLVKLAAGGFAAFEAVAIWKEFAQEAAHAEQLARGMQNIAENAGLSTVAVNDAAEAIQKLGVTSDTTAKNMTRLIVAGVNPEQATALAKVAKNIAATFGKPVGEVFDEIVHSVSRGTTRLLEIQYGLHLNAQQVFLQKSRELQRPLHEQERRSALASAVAAQGNAQFSTVGDGAEAASAKLDQLSVATSNLREHIGDLFLDTFKASIDTSKEFVRGIDFLIQSFHNGTEAADRLYTSTTAISTGFRDFRDTVIALNKALKENADIIIAVGAALGALALSTFLAVIAASTGAVTTLGTALGLLALEGGVAAVATALLSTVLGGLGTAVRLLAAAIFSVPGPGWILAIIVALVELYNRSVLVKGAVDAVAALFVTVGALIVKSLVTPALAAAAAVQYLFDKFVNNNPEAAEASLKILKDHLEDILQTAQQIPGAAQGAVEDAKNPKKNTPPPVPITEAEKAAAIAAFKAKEAQRTELDNLAAAAEKKRLKDIAESELKYKNSLAKIADTQALEQAKARQALLKVQNDQSEAIQKEGYDTGRVALDDYYAGRLKREKEGVDAELAVQRKVIANLNAEAARAASEGGEGGFIRAAEARANAVKEQEKLNEIRAKGELTYAKTRIERNAAVLKDFEAAQTIRDQLAKDQNPEDLQAALKDIQDKYETQIRSLHAVEGSEQRLQLTRKKAHDDFKTQMDIDNAKLQRTFDLSEAIRKTDQAISDYKFKSGQITEVDHLNETNASIREQVKNLEALRKEKQAQSVKAYQNNEIGAYNTSQKEVADLGLQIAQARGQLDTLGDRFAKNFSDALSNGIEALINRTKTLKDALLGVANDFRGALVKAGSAQLAQTGTKALIEATGGAGNSVFDSIAKLFGEKGTLSNPMIVMFPPGVDQGKELTKAFGGVDDSAVEKATDGFFDKMKKSFTDGFSGLEGLFAPGGAINSVFQSIGTGFQSLIGNSIGSFAGFSPLDAAGWDALALLGDGGDIYGPSHAQGGVPIVAEGGEYMINKRQTARWRPLLSMINSGSFDGFGETFTPRRSFAEGGQVQGGGGGTGSTSNAHVEVHFHGEDAKVNGSDSQSVAFGRVVSDMIQRELIKQKRTNGILGSQ